MFDTWMEGGKGRKTARLGLEIVKNCMAQVRYQRWNHEPAPRKRIKIPQELTALNRHSNIYKKESDELG